MFPKALSAESRTKYLVWLLILTTLTLNIPAQAQQVAKEIKEAYNLERAKDFDEAIRAYEKIITDAKATPSQLAKVHIRLGKCYKKKKDNNKAAEQFQYVITNFPEQAMPLKTAEAELKKLGIDPVKISKQKEDLTQPEKVPEEEPEIALALEPLPDVGPLFWVIQDGNFGYINQKGELAIKPQFVWASDFAEGLAAVVPGPKNEDGSRGKIGYINQLGQLVIKPKFNYCGPFSEGLAVASDNSGKFDYIDKTGKWVTEKNFEMAHDFSGGLARVMVLSYYRFIDKTGNLVVKSKLNSASDFSEGLAAIQQGSRKLGYIDNTGKYVIQTRLCDYGHAFSDGLALVSIGGKYGYIDKNGEILMQLQFVTDAQDFSEGLAAVATGKIIRQSKKEQLKALMDYNPEGITRASRQLSSGTYGYMNKQGDMVIRPQFSQASRFSQGLAAVQIEGKFGYINKEGEIVVEPQFDSALEFRDGLAQVWRTGLGEGKWAEPKLGYIDKTGKFVWEPTL
ncbi:MAG: WG repeat-containing protein [Sedimentisphaerales bacterium]|nr:WG repeat-containing protein [Sedimentisphaerales bacterium]